MLTRRENLHLAIGLAAGFAITQDLKSVAQAAEPPFKLPPLGYGYDALEPTIDTLTMTIHHDRHHGAYVAALNKVAEQYPELATKPLAVWLSDLSSVPEAFRTPVRNNLGGHWNHSFFWDLMTPRRGQGTER